MAYTGSEYTSTFSTEHFTYKFGWNYCSLLLRSKLEFESNFSRKHKDKALQSARAVVILVPIFGLHFLLLPIRPVKGSSLEYTYEVRLN